MAEGKASIVVQHKVSISNQHPPALEYTGPPLSLFRESCIYGVRSRSYIDLESVHRFRKLAHTYTHHVEVAALDPTNHETIHMSLDMSI